MDVTWRGTLPVDGQAETQMIYLTCANGDVLRLRLPLADARHLANSLLDYQGDHDRRCGRVAGGVSYLQTAPEAQSCPVKSKGKFS